MAAKFSLVKYGHYNYGNINTNVTEVAGHFDVTSIKVSTAYSLHTEYSYGARKFNSKIFEKLLTLQESVSCGIPLLWFSEKWCHEFYEFLLYLIGTNHAPDIIEIHPPFRSYVHNFECFLGRFRIFENLVREKYPDTLILLENRYGTLNHDKFLVERIDDVLGVLEEINRNNVTLGIVLDIPQIISSGSLKEVDEIISEIDRLGKLKANIRAIHLWGNEKRAHSGNLSSLFGNSESKKDKFLDFLSVFFDDGLVRFLVPEVNLSKQEVFDNLLHDISNNFELI